VAVRAAAALTLTLVLLAGCGHGAKGKPDTRDPDKLANEINQVATVKPPAPPPPPTLQPLLVVDLAALPPEAGVCRLTRDRKVLLVGGAREAVARIGGRLFHLAAAGPVDGTAAFYVAGPVTISIGRGDGGATPAGVAGQAQVALSTPKAGPGKLDAFWSCGR
jgi:hypothetical protein